MLARVELEAEAVMVGTVPQEVRVETADLLPYLFRKVGPTLYKRMSKAVLVAQAVQVDRERRQGPVERQVMAVHLGQPRVEIAVLLDCQILLAVTALPEVQEIQGLLA